MLNFDQSKKSEEIVFAKENIPISVLLIDDQLIVAEAVNKMIADQSDIIFHYCNDPSNVIEMVTQVHPTVILQDLVMPDIDGLMLVRYLRANPTTQDVPLIVLSSKEEPIIKAEAFALGANDYMVKLPDRVELIARIRYHSAAYIRLLERNEAYKKLEESQQALNFELAEAATYVKSLIPQPFNELIKVDWRFIPSTQLGGDALGYQWIDEDNFFFFLLDVCGHGVGAALLSISVMNVLRSQNLSQMNFLEPNLVLNALNENFPMEEHNNMFFTIWYGVYNRQTSLLKYSSGGHPPAILIQFETDQKESTLELRTDGPVIGATSTAHFSCGSSLVKKGNRLYLFSDGIYELAKPDGAVLQLEEFIKEIERLSIEKNGGEIDRIIKYSRSLVNGKPFIDDVSILEITF